MVALAALLIAAPPARFEGTRLPVPVVRQARERCGPAALEMVLRFYGADSSAARIAGTAYDPVLRGSLITDLAAAARRAGFAAEVETLEPDSLIGLLGLGVPPILLYSVGPSPVTRLHYVVVVGWEPGQRSYVLNDGSSRPSRVAAGLLERRWKSAGRQALVVRRRAP